MSKVRISDRKVFIADEDQWITIKGAHVLIGENGEVKAGAGGALKGRSFSSAKSVGSASKKGDKALTEKFQKQVEHWKNAYKKDKYNLTIQEELYNSKEYLKHSKTIDLSKDKFSGIKASLAITSLDGKSGAKFKISGAGRYDGEYTVKYWSKPGFHSGYECVRSGDGRTFGLGQGNVASTLGLIRGGRVQENKSVKVQIMKR